MLINNSRIEVISKRGKVLMVLPSEPSDASFDRDQERRETVKEILKQIPEDEIEEVVFYCPEGFIIYSHKTKTTAVKVSLHV